MRRKKYVKSIGYMKASYNTQTRKHCRYLTAEWQKEQLRNNDYTCFISGKQSTMKKRVNLDVHHLEMSFDEIIKLAHKNLGLEYHHYTNEYDSEDLDLLDKEIIRIHNEEITGIVLTPELHDALHRRYGANPSMDDIRESKRYYRSHRHKSCNSCYKNKNLA